MDVGEDAGRVGGDRWMPMMMPVEVGGDRRNTRRPGGIGENGGGDVGRVDGDYMTHVGIRA